MATKKKSKASTEQALKAQVKTLKADLASAKAKRDKWKKRAQTAETEVAGLRRERKQAEKRARKAAGKTTGKTPGKTTPKPTATTVTALPVSASDGTSAGRARTRRTPPVPDESWTLAALRDEARRRGVTGLSGKPKADVLAALR